MSAYEGYHFGGAFRSSDRIDSVDLLKVDIEGAEKLLFASTQTELIERFVRLLLSFMISCSAALVNRGQSHYEAAQIAWLLPHPLLLLAA